MFCSCKVIQSEKGDFYFTLEISAESKTWFINKNNSWQYNYFCGSVLSCIIVLVTHLWELESLRSGWEKPKLKTTLNNTFSLLFFVCFNAKERLIVWLYFVHTVTLVIHLHDNRHLSKNQYLLSNKLTDNRQCKGTPKLFGIQNKSGFNSADIDRSQDFTKAFCQCGRDSLSACLLSSMS